MKFEIENATLLKFLKTICGTVSRSNAVPILSNVLIKATENSVILSACDLTQLVVRELVAPIEEGGSVTAGAHLLLAVISKLPKKAMSRLSLDDGKLVVRCGREIFNILTLPVDDYPTMEIGELPVKFEIPAATLKEIIDKTRFVISTEETRYYLNGIFLHVTDDATPVLKAAATDGHRLARVTVARPEGAAGMPDIIVPRKCIAELRKLLDEVDGSVEVSLSPSKIRFSMGTAVLTSKLIDGTFPDYSRVIPTGNYKILRIDPKSFMEGVDRVATIASEKTRAVKMALDTDKITLSVTSPENGTAQTTVDCEYSANGFEIGFNARYLMDILAQIDGDSVEVHLAEAATPTLIKENDKASALYVLMPMRV